jgi:hypothetical protein
MVSDGTAGFPSLDLILQHAKPCSHGSHRQRVDVITPLEV